MARRITWMVALLFVALCVTTAAAATEEGSPKPAYDLVVKDDQVSLRVTDGLVVEIIEDLGRQLGFEVVAMSVHDLKISDTFERLPSREAIRRICASAGYIEVPDPNTDKIVRLVLTGANAVDGANVLAPRRDPLPDRRPPPAATGYRCNQAEPALSASRHGSGQASPFIHVGRG